MSINEIIFAFFPKLALVHKPCRLMGFLLILKESHRGKNLSFVTSAEREVKVSRRSGMYQSYNFLTRLGMQSL